MWNVINFLARQALHSVDALVMVTMYHRCPEKYEDYHFVISHSSSWRRRISNAMAGFT